MALSRRTCCGRTWTARSCSRHAVAASGRLPDARLLDSQPALVTDLQDIDLFFFHQANLRINQFIAQQLQIPEEKVPHNIERYGNTTAATIPLLLAESAREKGALCAVRRSWVMVAFGSGFTWGAVADIADWCRGHAQPYPLNRSGEGAVRRAALLLVLAVLGCSFDDDDAGAAGSSLNGPRRARAHADPAKLTAAARVRPGPSPSSSVTPPSASASSAPVWSLSEKPVLRAARGRIDEASERRRDRLRRAGRPQRRVPLLRPAYHGAWKRRRSAHDPRVHAAVITCVRLDMLGKAWPGGHCLVSMLRDISARAPSAGPSPSRLPHALGHTPPASRPLPASAMLKWQACDSMPLAVTARHGLPR